MKNFSFETPSNINPTDYILQNILHRLIIAVISFPLILSAAGCGGASELTGESGFQALQKNINDKFDEPDFSNAYWGAAIKSLNTGKTWYSRNADKLFMPASNEKIPTGASALVTLGPDFKFETDLCYNGTIIDSVLNGDLIVFGNGDPTLYTRFYDDPRELFDSWAAKLKEIGIKRINGNIIGDDNAFGEDSLGYGWSYDGLVWWYSAQVGALQLNENYVDLKIVPPDSIGSDVKIIPNLPSNYYNIKNEITIQDTGRTRVTADRGCGSNEIILSGAVKRGGKPFTISPTISNPTLFYTTVLKEVLDSLGISVIGRPEDCDNISNWNHKAADFVLLDAHYSAPLKDILTVMLKRSQNLYAETFARVLGLAASGRGTFSAGKKVVEEVLEKFGIEKGTYRYMDGSGLSRYDYISPDQILKILIAMYNSPYREVWYNALPIAGIDGTLRGRMKGTAAEGNARAKTGTISNVRALSGYVTTASGEMLAFSFLVNAHLMTARDTERITDGVLELLASYKGSF